MSLSLVARQYIQATTYINIPSIMILYELSTRNHHTNYKFIHEVSMEFIQEDHCDYITKISDYPNEYYQLQIDRSVDEIHSNLVRWTNG